MTAMTQTNKEYASALFMLGVENGAVDEYESHLESIRDIFEKTTDYIKVLESPAIPLSERLSLIDEAFEKNSPEYIVSFIKILCENGHIREICQCIDEFKELVRIYKNRTVATVYYVEPLTDEQKDALLKKLETVSGKNVETVYVKDENLIGGIKVQIDDKIFDGSIKNRLNKAKGVISE